MASALSSTTKLKRIGILGAGQMGASAAVLFRRAGYEVMLWSRNAERLEQARPTVAECEAFLERHFGAAAATAGTLTLEPDLARLDQECDALLECVVEDMAQKVALLSQLTSVKERGALVMSCTSALCITDMATQSGLGPLLVGAHFWNPPHLIPVVEVISGKESHEAHVEATCELLKSAGKIPVKCADVKGFVGNRLMHAMWREALALVEAGTVTAEDLDKVVKWTFALRLPALGPMENMDLVGLKLVHQVESYLLPDLATNAAPSQELETRLKEGQTGMSAGQGFYDWTERDAKATIRLRDEQIVRQLQFLREAGVLDA